MEVTLKHTDSLNSGAFIINEARKEYSPFGNYDGIYLTQEGNTSLKQEILKIIDNANNVLKICSFIITDKEISDAILNKVKNTDVAVFILTQLDSSKLENLISLVDFMTEEEIKENPSHTHLTFIKKLFDNGVHVRASLSIHAKFIVADRTTGFITSANLTTPSLSFNTESGIYIDNKSSTELDRLFDAIYLQGTTYRQFLNSSKKGKMLVVQAEANLKEDLLPNPIHSNLRYKELDIEVYCVYAFQNKVANPLSKIISALDKIDKRTTI